jgi:hypothetical protein
MKRINTIKKVVLYISIGFLTLLLCFELYPHIAQYNKQAGKEKLVIVTDSTGVSIIDIQNAQKPVVVQKSPAY